MRVIVFLISLCSFCVTSVNAESRGLNVGAELGQHKTDFDYSGNIRETRLTRLGILWFEELTPAIQGGVELGYLEFTQYTNPIPAGQTGSGEYIGLNLSFIHIDNSTFQLLTRLSYRYNDARHKLDDQKIDWDWHEGRIGIHGLIRFSRMFSLGLGASYVAVDGREVAEGPVNQAQPFKADEPVSGHLGLQLVLDHAGTIGIEIDTGSLRGGRLVFQRVF